MVWIGEARIGLVGYGLLWSCAEWRAEVRRGEDEAVEIVRS
jgi:hypothetical protein